MLAFNEDTRVKFPATAHFMRLGYEYQAIKEADIDFETKIILNRFIPAISRLNGKDFTKEEIRTILDEINLTIKNNDLGKAFYNWLIEPNEKVKLIDFEIIENNDFAVIDELPFSIKENSEEGSFRPDINILINGMPLAFLEVKKPNNEGGIQKEFTRMINDRLKNEDYKKYFNMIQIVTFSNNMDYEDDDNADVDDVKVGSFYTTPNGQNTSFSFFREDDMNFHSNYSYKDITHEQIERILIEENYNPKEVDSPEFQTNLGIMTPCHRFITSFFDKERFMYYLQYGMMYLMETKKVKNERTNEEEEIPVPQKHIMRYPQFFATRKTIERLENGGTRGVIWHTQGSGKTALAAYSNRILRDYYSKKGIIFRMFFIVDRLDLMRQASLEFAQRNFNVINCKNKTELGKELSKPMTKSKDDTIGDIVVVNVQRIDPDKMPRVTNDYGAKVQRVFFIDEAHRSYSKGTGEFYKNLMTCDLNGVYIAMTGTPLLNTKERSNLRFGDYIHKYFYDKSIADGYTLRIMKEEIDTVAKSDIRAKLDIENQNIDDKTVYESEDYVNCVSEYIEKDFRHFRLQNTDNTIGGMIVCHSNEQAKSIHEWFKNNSSLTTGLVLSNTDDPKQDEINKNNQLSFKYDNVPDILVVNLMLTTGYDVHRLKKMYLLRAPKAHNLLQTISRVNRPYKNKKTGKVYKYGYIVDFVDISEEYNNSLQAYIKELEEDANSDSDENFTLDGLVVDKEDVQKRYLNFKSQLDAIPINKENLELFSRGLTMLNREALFKLRRLLRSIKECRTEFILSRADEYVGQIDEDRVKKMINSVQLRIDLLNLQSQSIDTLSIMNNKEVMEVIYEFLKVRVSIMNLSDLDATDEEVNRLKEVVSRLQKGLKENKNRNDIRIKSLEELLQQAFERMSIDNISDLTEELIKAAEEAEAINKENERIAAIYGGHYSFVKTFSESILNYDVDRTDVETLLMTAYEELQDKLKGDSIIVQGKMNFVKSVQKAITPKLFKSGLYGKIKGCMGEVLNDLYTNIQLFM